MNGTMRTIDYRYLDDDKVHTADVMVMDDNDVLDENYPYDERILFYFQNDNEFQEAFSEDYEDIESIGFVILGVHE